MKLTVFRAECGDAFLLQYQGKSGNKRNILLDMGRSKTYTSVLKNVICNLVSGSMHIDALFLSHIHDDHIGGATKFIKDLRHNDRFEGIVNQWIYNSPRVYDVSNVRATTDGVLCGIVSGDIIYEYLICYTQDGGKYYTSGMSFDIDGMNVTILSPNEDKLNDQKKKYANKRPLCKSESNGSTVTAGNVSDDYSIPLNEFDTEQFEEDASTENASSLAAIFEFKDKSILWLSDSVPSVIVDSLSKLGYSATNKLRCDSVLLSHHGSSANNSLTMLKMISADKYVISSDGLNRYCLPNKETIARIIKSASARPVKMYFNYCNGRLRKMFSVDNSDWLRQNLDIHYLNDFDTIDI